MSSSDFELNEEDHYRITLEEVNLNLSRMSDDYEKLEYLESIKTESLELASFCQLTIEKIENLSKYKKKFPHSTSSLTPEMVQNRKPKKTVTVGIIKPFTLFLLHEKSGALAEMLRSQFSIEKGKKIRLLIEAMQAHTPALISFVRGEKNSIYLAMKDFFSQNIGSYQSIFDYPFSPVSDTEDLKSIETRLNYILENL